MLKFKSKNIAMICITLMVTILILNGILYVLKINVKHQNVWVPIFILLLAISLVQYYLVRPSGETSLMVELISWIKKDILFRSAIFLLPLVAIFLLIIGHYNSSSLIKYDDFADQSVCVKDGIAKELKIGHPVRKVDVKQISYQCDQNEQVKIQLKALMIE